MSRKVWLVTGCSSGFGKLFVPAVLARGDQIVATARNASSLTFPNHPSDRIHVMQLDVTADQATLNGKVKEALAAFGRIDVLVNNAGFVVPGVWEEVR
jgi:NAD(P)-dependent dehydrogenase (short-subunit alcohol dehydrogenase family)